MTSSFTIVYVWRPSRLGVSEGLNVLLTDLIRGLSENQIPVRLLTTGRHIDGLREVLVKNHIPADRVEVVQLIRGSFFLALKDRWLERRNAARERGPSLLARLRESMRTHAERFFGWFLDINLLNALPRVIAVVLLGLAAALLFPVLLMLLILRQLSRRLLRPLVVRLKQRLIALARLTLSVSVSEKLYERESMRVGAAIDRHSDISAIFLPTAFEGYLCAHLRRTRKVVVFPDAVSLLFPTRFPGGEFSDLLLASMRLSVLHADGLVCYSNFVRDRQLQCFFHGECAQKPIAVIPQGFFVDDEFGERQVPDDRELNSYVRNYFPEYGGMPNTHFREFEAIIYPTVDRPHKNTLTLLKAFEVLLRERGRNVKLILTSPGGATETMDFIRERKLHRDVLFMPAVPILVLNQLLELASVMVHPSLAEGGDIFNFSRAVSHGTPALVADIPVAREMFERNGFELSAFDDWLFDATDHKALAEKLDKILCAEWQPLATQRQTLERLSSYRFADMAKKYDEFFQQISSN